MEKRDTWPERCQCGGKMIVIDVEVGEGLPLVVDVETRRHATKTRCLKCWRQRTFVKYEAQPVTSEPASAPPLGTPHGWLDRCEELRKRDAYPLPVLGSSIERDFQDFKLALAWRLSEGERQYGESSLTRPPQELVGEIEEELLDVCGWAFLLWLRVRRMELKGKKVMP